MHGEPEGTGEVIMISKQGSRIALLTGLAILGSACRGPSTRPAFVLGDGENTPANREALIELVNAAGAARNDTNYRVTVSMNVLGNGDKEGEARTTGAHRSDHKQTTQTALRMEQGG